MGFFTAWTLHENRQPPRHSRKKTSASTDNQRKKSIKTSGLIVKSAIKAGGLGSGNHNAGLRAKSAIKAGGLGSGNHNVLVRRS
jgi:hypothetical protein